MSGHPSWWWTTIPLPLLRQVWGEHATSSAQPVRTAVKKLRRKLGDQARKPTYIFTVIKIKPPLTFTEQDADCVAD